jgi:pimeloyl-ACP methyl ester carboxylesterase
LGNIANQLMKFKISIFTSFILLVSLSVSTILFTVPSWSPTANAQTACDNGVVHASTKALPVILIHGYNEGSYIWSTWEKKLAENGIPFCTVSFNSSSDKCGTADDHASEIGQIIQEVKRSTGESQVNLVGHSKGGLDARVYLANTQTPDAANLIMLGTPNGGDSFADHVDFLNPWLRFSPPNPLYCTPALFDLETTADDTKVTENPNTNYRIIYGNWNTSLPCSDTQLLKPSFEYLSNRNEIPNDGLVSQKSVESLKDFSILGSTKHCHLDLTSEQEFDLSKKVMLSR